MSGGGVDEGVTLEFTPTWVVPAVCTVIVALWLPEERLLHYAGKHLKNKNQKPLFEALQKVKRRFCNMAKDQLHISDLDFFYDLDFSAFFDEQPQEEGDVFSVSDIKYAEELQFQEALMGSVIISQKKNNDPSTISDRPEMPMEMITEDPGESSLSFCEICVERKESNKMFKADSCVHSFCSDCITKHVAIKIEQNNSIVTCPGLDCKAVLELETCRATLPKGVIDSWEEALCVEFISMSQRFYCPYKDCSAMLVDDNEGEPIKEAECPFCHRLFCAMCCVPWHSGFDCEEYQRLNEDERGREDLMLIELAKDNKWGRCPQCKFYVERTEGCPHMTCRCKFQFCYGCGAEWAANHGGCRPRE